MSMIGGRGAGLSPAQSEVLKHFSVDDANRRILVDWSIETQPSTFYVGSIGISNGVRAISYKLATGERAIGLVNRFDMQNGSLSNPVFVALGGRAENLIETSTANVIADPFELQFQATGDFIYLGFNFVPHTAGEFRAQFWLGNDENGADILDTVREVTQAEVEAGQPVFFEFPNSILLYHDDPLFLRLSGIELKGGAALPYYVTQVMPIKEVTINGHVEHVTESQSIFIGCDYGVDTTGGSVTLTVPATFKDRFRVYDHKGTFTSSNKCIIDFSAFNQGTFEMTFSLDDCEFYYIENDVWYVNDIKGNQRGRIG